MYRLIPDVQDKSTDSNYIMKLLMYNYNILTQYTFYDTNSLTVLKFSVLWSDGLGEASYVAMVTSCLCT